MARRPFYGQGGAIPIARMNMQAATAPGRAYAQMGKDFGDKIGSALKTYGENKKKGEAAEMGIGSILESMSNERKEELASGEGPLSKNLQKFMEGELPNSKKEALLGSLVTLDNRDRMDRQEELSRQTAQLNQTLTSLGISQKTKEIGDDAAKNEFLSGLFTKDESGNAPISKFLTAVPEFGDIAVKSPETALGLLQSFQKRIDESGKVAGTTKIDNGDGPRVIGYNKKGSQVVDFGKAPTTSLYGSPEEQIQAEIGKQRQTTANNFIDDTRKTALSFSQTMTAANRLTDLLDKGVETGGISQMKAGLSTFAQSLGVELPEEIKKQTAMTQAFTQASGEFLFNAISNTKGSISEKEMDIFERMSPGMKNSVEGNRLMLEFVKQVGAREKLKIQLIRSLEKEGVMPLEIANQVEQFMLDNDLSGNLPQVEEAEQSVNPIQQPMAPGPIKLKGGGTFTPAR